MPRQLFPLSISGPGQRGLNTQDSAANLDVSWCTSALNCVIDRDGRVASRKGYAALTSSPISATPAIEQVFEYQDDSNTVEIVSAAANKLYSGTTTLTEKTGSLTITDSHWKFQNFNGNVIGFQASHSPIIYTGSGNFTLLQAEIDDWATGTSYSIGDVVKATSGNTTIYFHCTTAGTSHASTEPTWDTTAGNTTADNSVTWTTRTFPNGNECFAAHGRLWCFDSTHTVLQYSDLLLPYKFSGGTSGSINLKAVWSYGMDVGVSIVEFNNFLIIFGERSVTIYSGADDVSTMTLNDVVDGIGCIARDSVQPIGHDIYYLSNTGVRTFSRTIQEKSMPVGDASYNVRDLLNIDVAAETAKKINSVYDQQEGFYLLSFPTQDTVYCFDVRALHRNPEDNTPRVTTWNAITPTALCSTRANEVLLGQPGVIGQYDTYLDDASTYEMSVRLAWSNLSGVAEFRGMVDPLAARVKIPKKMQMTVKGGYGYTLEFNWAFDYDSITTTSDGAIVSAVSVAAPLYGIGEYGIAEYGGGDILSTASVHMTKSGQVIQLGFDTTVNGEAISLQKVDLLVKLGRLVA